MKKSITTHEAKTHLSRLIEEVLSGADIVICRGKSPVVRIVKYESGDHNADRPKIGTITSAPVSYSKDAFAPLSDLETLKTWGME